MEYEFLDEVPRSVGEARARFNFIADSALARRLQDEEFRGHFSANKQERQLIGRVDNSMIQGRSKDEACIDPNTKFKRKPSEPPQFHSHSPLSPRSDAKASHDELLDEILKQEALRMENIKQTLMLDEEMAGRLQRKFDGEAILSKLLAKNQDESDARLARELHKKERNRQVLYSRRPYPPNASSHYDSDEERPPTPPPHGRRIVQKEGRGNDRNNAMKTNFKTKELCIAKGAKHDRILEVVTVVTEIGEAREKIIDDTVKAFGGIDILSQVINVGQSESATDCNGLSVEMFEMKTLKSMLVLTNLAVPHLVKSSGAVLNVSSIATLPCTMQESSFITTRSAIDNLIVQTATMLMNTGIRVNSVNHGLLKTGMVSKLDLPKEYEGALIYLGQNVWILPFGRVADSSDIAKLIVFLSDHTQSQLIVGQRVIVE
ncbi:hypothetical protein PRIPAC_97467 [Pristionchus pacificus]|uniref:Uncharacterized protein n=1 Tax=Pristionchus pacificus TaxID=54126 RepID=A0A2A6D2L1_PRIPA|nr:hypothetical protein PRIPAC_97467 [Pristionchus pacificus]|eukprot:PDM84523.1 hypothetical protein PRIPAC_33546 [Pristionchus pacificus]